MAVDHQVVIPADRLPAVIETASNIDQRFGGEHAIRGIARRVIGRSRKAELMRCKAAGVRVYFLRPFLTGLLIEGVFRTRMVIHPNFVAKPATEKGGGWDSEDLTSQIPKRHLHAADSAHQVVGGPVGASAAELARAFAHARIKGV